VGAPGLDRHGVPVEPLRNTTFSDFYDELDFPEFEFQQPRNLTTRELRAPGDMGPMHIQWGGRRHAFRVRGFVKAMWRDGATP
jgi:hypothetical protein